jgi:DinB superfamily
MSLRNATLDQLLVAGMKVTDHVEQRYQALSAAALGWQPAPKDWGIGQCFEHLTVSTTVYFPILDPIVAGNHQPVGWERVPGLPKLYAGMLLGSLTPEATSKLPTAPILEPVARSFDTQVIVGYLASQRRLAEYIQASRALPCDTLIITSPFASFVTYSLLDAYRIIVSHSYHHLTQARRVSEMPGFPGASIAAIVSD